MAALLAFVCVLTTWVGCNSTKDESYYVGRIEKNFDKLDKIMDDLDELYQKAKKGDISNIDKKAESLIEKADKIQKEIESDGEYITSQDQKDKLGERVSGIIERFQTITSQGIEDNPFNLDNMDQE
jgi:hypothetical protein